MQQKFFLKDNICILKCHFFPWAVIKLHLDGSFIFLFIFLCSYLLLDSALDHFA